MVEKKNPFRSSGISSGSGAEGGKRTRLRRGKLTELKCEKVRFNVVFLVAVSSLKTLLFYRSKCWKLKNLFFFNEIIQNQTKIFRRASLNTSNLEAADSVTFVD